MVTRARFKRATPSFGDIHPNRTNSRRRLGFSRTYVGREHSGAPMVTHE